MAFSNSKWIWLAEGASCDQYAEFVDTVMYDGGEAFLRISCDSDYAVFINGSYASSGQYGDFEHYKIYDEIEITSLLKKGMNKLTILGYHCGTATARYRPAAAGLIYEVEAAGKLMAFSREDVLSRKSPNYTSGLCRFLSVQLGFTFEYDAEGEELAFSSSVAVSKSVKLFPRPIKKQRLLPERAIASLQKVSDTHYLVDLGGECVGLPRLALFSATRQTVTVAFGEHIKDGCVRKIIGKRNLYYTYKTKIGENSFTEYMLRLGCRYFEVFSEEPIELRYVGLLPQVYEVEEIPVHIENELDRRIYSACVNTLKLCMMEHYVDCPWREQALYAFDSRNQMLCGYYAFEGGNAEYARANLKLMSEDRRPDGFLSLTYPSGTESVIPAFSLHYIVAMREYVAYTGDRSLATEMLPKMRGILEEFLKGRRDGLICGVKSPHIWNFYDWTEGANFGWNCECEPDLFINCLFIMALDAYEKMCREAGREFQYPGLKCELTALTRDRFLTDKKLFDVQKGKENLTILGNSLAILSGVATREEAEIICERIVSGALSDCSLSARVFKYEALLSTNAEKHRGFVTSEIRATYRVMLYAGSDTVWETLGGCDDFSGAGSLCHGWSSVPVYFYHRLGIAEADSKK